MEHTKDCNDTVGFCKGEICNCLGSSAQNDESLRDAALLSHSALVGAAREALNLNVWTTPPIYCPFCGYRGTSKLTELDQWAAVSSQDTENTATIVEWQCMGTCEGRSFWV